MLEPNTTYSTCTALIIFVMPEIMSRMHEGLKAVASAMKYAARRTRMHIAPFHICGKTFGYQILFSLRAVTIRLYKKVLGKLLGL